MKKLLIGLICCLFLTACETNIKFNPPINPPINPPSSAK